MGLSFAACVLRGKLYSRETTMLRSSLYLLPTALAWLLLDVALRFLYRDMGIVGVKYLPAALFTVGWTLVLTGLVALLPGKAKWVGRWVPFVLFALLSLAHSAFVAVFRRFFSFSALTFAGVGSFVETDYIQFRPGIIVALLVAAALLFLSGRLQKAVPPRGGKRGVLLALLIMAVGAVLVVAVHSLCFAKQDTVIWEQTGQDAASSAYQNYTDSSNALMVSGLYQYTVRDLWMRLTPGGSMTEEERQQVEGYITDYEAAQTDNAYTGLLAGKNVLMVQLEAIDTWMLSEDYMPNLWKLKQEGLSFANHYTPAYITAGTFNTEFIANTGLLPATGGIPTSVYNRDSFPFSLAHLFAQKGYTARSFHGSEGTVYDRGAIHLNLGYEGYYSGSDMGMVDYQLDRYLIDGFDTMTEQEPFFSFVITYSGHGPYGEENIIYLPHADEARAAAARTDGNYVYAVAGAMETDLFIGELMAALEESGHLEDTVLVFYADHYNYYMMDDALNMEIKGVDNINLLQHTDFFLWSKDLPSGQVDKVTSSLDVLPTLANLFDLDTTGAFLLGHDGLGQQGGYVFFSDGSWYDGETYWASSSGQDSTGRSAEIARATTLNNWVLSGDYYGNQS